MATNKSLTWQDVAGVQVRAPDLSDATDAITSGIAGLGQSVKNVISGPENLRKEEALQELKRLDLSAARTKEMNQETNAFFKDQEARSDRADARVILADKKAFGAIQSEMGGKARAAGLAGVTFDQFVQSEDYLKIPEGVRAQGQDFLYDVHSKADYTRLAQDEDNRDDLQRKFDSDRSFGLQQSQARAADGSRALSDQAARLQIAKAQREEDKIQSRIYPSAVSTNTLGADGTATRDFVQKRFNAVGGETDKLDLAKIAKDAGFTKIAEATTFFNARNAYRQSLGLPTMPQTVLKSQIAGGVGKQGLIASIGNAYDLTEFKENLKIREVMFDASEVEERVQRELHIRASNGEVITMDKVQQALNAALPKKEDRPEDPFDVSNPADKIPTYQIQRDLKKDPRYWDKYIGNWQNKD